MSPDIPRYIVRSVLQFLQLQLDDYTILIEGQKKPEKQADKILELRFDGPYFRSQDSGNYSILLRLNVLIKQRIGTDLYAIHRSTGDVVASMQAMTVYNDSDAALFCLMLSDIPIRVKQYGAIDRTEQVQLATVEAEFHANYTER